MKDFIDIHTHSLSGGHAYSTIKEMVLKAAEKGLKVFGVTEHAESCTQLHFRNMRIILREQYGITVLHGAEANIIDYDGHLDLPDRILADLDVVVASMHMSTYKGGTMEENTRAYLNVMKNPHVAIIGHPDDCRFPVDYRELVLGAKRYGKLLEINNISVNPTGFRDTERAIENYRKMLEYCKEYETPVIMSSDAHIDVAVGDHTEAMKVLKDVDFPERLVVNSDVEMLKKYIKF